MNNNLFTPKPLYSKQREYAKTRPIKIGGTAKTNRTMKIRRQRENIEEEFMAFSYKIGRSDKQREERRGKRGVNKEQ